MNIDRAMQYIGMEISQERILSGLSQLELAKKAKITQQMLSKVESGQFCSMKTLLKICKTLDKQILYLSTDK